VPRGHFESNILPTLADGMEQVIAVREPIV